MSVLRFIIRSFYYYRKQHLALFAATLLSTAVLTGALVVGDSVKYSLENIVQTRLGKTEFALVAHERFFESRLAADIAKKAHTQTAPVLMLRGFAINSETNQRINSVQVLGVDAAFGKFSEIPLPDLLPNEAIISENIADLLNLKAGETLLLRVEKANIIPLNAPFVSDENSAIALRLKIKAIAGDNQLGRFSLSNDQNLPFNVFLQMDFLAKKLELPGLANLVLVSENKRKLDTLELNTILRQCWKLPDASIKINDLSKDGKFELISDRIFIDKPISESIQKLELQNESVLTYLVNSIRFHDKSTPYSFVSALSGDFFNEKLYKNEIIINQWLADDLGLKTGDTVGLDYFVIGHLRKLEEKSKTFIVKKIIPTQGDLADKSLMPMFPGISEASSCSDWETGIPIDLKKIRNKDEDYWNRYKGTPKAIISLEAGQEIWDNKFGNRTAIRFNKSDISIENLSQKILQKLDPAMIGFSFSPVLLDGLSGSKNSVDFGGLFLSLSFFVIFAGILLTVLIYTLNTETRSRETGVMAALGFTNRKIIGLRLAETFLITIPGGLAGVGAGILYNTALLAGLNSVWRDAVQTDMLEVFIKPTTLVISGISGILLAGLSVLVVTLKKMRQPISDLVKKNMLGFSGNLSRKIPWNLIVAFTGILASLLLISVSLILDKTDNASAFLTSGAVFMLGCFALIDHLLSRKSPNKFVRNPNIFRLAIKYIGRNKNRSLAAIILLSVGVFSIIITAANRKTFFGAENLPQSGTGGYLFWAQTTLPVLFDLNSETGKSKVGLDGEQILKDVRFVQFHKFDGDDASCLNLNQVEHPPILGFDPVDFQKKKAFSFAKVMKGIDKTTLWQTLEKPFAPGIIPAIADQTMLTWSLKKKTGDTLVYTDEAGKPLKLLLVAGMENSIFQGNLLISDSLFMVHFPSVSGSKVLLVQANDSIKSELSELLKNTFSDYGIQLTSASKRLAQFYAVENTYLTVFMLLGGLGVLIGTLGLGIVLLRNIIERKNEMALLMALGYRKAEIFKIVFIENLAILLIGLTIGILGAFAGIIPSLVSPSFSFSPIAPLLIILLVLITGIATIFFAARSFFRKNLIDVLKNE